MQQDFSQLVRDAITAREWSIAEAARQSGMTAAQLSDYLSRKKQLRGDTLERLFDVLGLRVKPQRK